MKLKQVLLRMAAFLTLITFGSETLFAQSLSVNVSAAQPREFQTEVRQNGLPEDLGRVVESNSAFPSFILIQDPHGHYQGQKNIQKILELLKKETGFKTLLVEGGTGRLYPEYLDFFQEEKWNQAAAETLARAAEIGGPELFLADSENRRAVTAYGIEDEKIYLENLKQFQEVAASRAETDLYVQNELRRLKTEASKTLNPQLYHFFKQWLAYEVSEIPLTEFIQALERAAQENLKIDLRDPWQQRELPMLVRYAELKRREPLLDGKKAREEEDLLFAWANAKGIETPRYQTGNSEFLDRRDYWETFYLDAAPKGFDFKDYPALSLREGAKILQEEMDGKLFLSEIEKLRDQICEKLTSDSAEQTFLDQAKQLLLLKKLFHLELTPEEFGVLEASALQGLPLMRQNRKAAEVEPPSLRGAEGDEAITSPRVASPRKVTARNDVENRPSFILSVFQNAINFYKTAKRRDQIMFEKMAAHLNSSSKMISPRRSVPPPIVVIAGGFHTPGFLKEIKEKKLTYAVLNPHLPELQSSENYLDAMTGAKPKLDLAAFTTRVPQWETVWSQPLPASIQARRRGMREDILSAGKKAGAREAVNQVRSEIRGIEKWESMPQSEIEMRAVILRLAILREPVNFSALLKYFQKKLDPGISEKTVREMLETYGFRQGESGEDYDFLVKTEVLGQLSAVTPNDSIHQEMEGVFREVNEYGKAIENPQGGILSPIPGDEQETFAARYALSHKFENFLPVGQRYNSYLVRTAALNDIIRILRRFEIVALDEKAEVGAALIKDAAAKYGLADVVNSFRTSSKKKQFLPVHIEELKKIRQKVTLYFVKAASALNQYEQQFVALESSRKSSVEMPESEIEMRAMILRLALQGKVVVLGYLTNYFKEAFDPSVTEGKVAQLLQFYGFNFAGYSEAGAQYVYSLTPEQIHLIGAQTLPDEKTEALTIEGNQIDQDLGFTQNGDKYKSQGLSFLPGEDQTKGEQGAFRYHLKHRLVGALVFWVGVASVKESLERLQQIILTLKILAGNEKDESKVSLGLIRDWVLNYGRSVQFNAEQKAQLREIARRLQLVYVKAASLVNSFEREKAAEIQARSEVRDESGASKNKPRAESQVSLLDYFNQVIPGGDIELFRKIYKQLWKPTTLQTNERKRNVMIYVLAFNRKYFNDADMPWPDFPMAAAAVGGTAHIYNEVLNVMTSQVEAAGLKAPVWRVPRKRGANKPEGKYSVSEREMQDLKMYIEDGLSFEDEAEGFEGNQRKSVDSLAKQLSDSLGNKVERKYQAYAGELLSIAKRMADYLEAPRWQKNFIDDTDVSTIYDMTRIEWDAKGTPKMWRQMLSWLLNAGDPDFVLYHPVVTEFFLELDQVMGGKYSSWKAANQALEPIVNRYNSEHSKRRLPVRRKKTDGGAASNSAEPQPVKLSLYTGANPVPSESNPPAAENSGSSSAEGQEDQGDSARSETREVKAKVYGDENLNWVFPSDRFAPVAFSSALSGLYSAGRVSWESRFSEWDSDKVSKKRRVSVAVVVRNIDGHLYFLLAKKDNKFVLPGGKLEEKKDKKLEGRINKEELLRSRLAEASDFPLKNESVPAGLLREAREETGVEGVISARLDDLLISEDDASKLIHAFVISSVSAAESAAAIDPADEELSSFSWVPLSLVYRTPPAAIKSTLEKNLGGEIHELAVSVIQNFMAVLKVLDQSLWSQISRWDDLLKLNERFHFSDSPSQLGIKIIRRHGEGKSFERRGLLSLAVSQGKPLVEIKQISGGAEKEAVIHYIMKGGVQAETHFTEQEFISGGVQIFIERAEDENAASQRSESRDPRLAALGKNLAAFAGLNQQLNEDAVKKARVDQLFLSEVSKNVMPGCLSGVFFLGAAYVSWHQKKNAPLLTFISLIGSLIAFKMFFDGSALIAPLRDAVSAQAAERADKIRQKHELLKTILEQARELRLEPVGSQVKNPPDQNLLGIVLTIAREKIQWFQYLRRTPSFYKLIEFDDYLPGLSVSSHYDLLNEKALSYWSAKYAFIQEIGKWLSENEGLESQVVGAFGALLTAKQNFIDAQKENGLDYFDDTDPRTGSRSEMRNALSGSWTEENKQELELLSGQVIAFTEDLLRVHNEAVSAAEFAESSEFSQFAGALLHLQNWIQNHPEIPAETKPEWFPDFNELDRFSRWHSDYLKFEKNTNALLLENSFLYWLEKILPGTTVPKPIAQQPARLVSASRLLGEREQKKAAPRHTYGWLAAELGMTHQQVLDFLERPEIAWNVMTAHEVLRKTHGEELVPGINRLGITRAGEAAILGIAGFALALGVGSEFQDQIEAQVQENFGDLQRTAEVFGTDAQSLQRVYSRVLDFFEGNPEANLTEIPLAPGKFLKTLAQAVKKYDFSQTVIDEKEMTKGRLQLDQFLKKEMPSSLSDLTEETLQPLLLKWIQTPDAENKIWNLAQLKTEIARFYPKADTPQFNEAKLLWGFGLEGDFYKYFETIRAGEDDLSAPGVRTRLGMLLGWDNKAASTSLDRVLQAFNQLESEWEFYTGLLPEASGRPLPPAVIRRTKEAAEIPAAKPSGPRMFTVKVGSQNIRTSNQKLAVILEKISRNENLDPNGEEIDPALADASGQIDLGEILESGRRLIFVGMTSFGGTKDTPEEERTVYPYIQKTGEKVYQLGLRVRSRITGKVFILRSIIFAQDGEVLTTNPSKRPGNLESNQLVESNQIPYSTFPAVREVLSGIASGDLAEPLRKFRASDLEMLGGGFFSPNRIDLWKEPSDLGARSLRLDPRGYSDPILRFDPAPHLGGKTWSASIWTREELLANNGENAPVILRSEILLDSVIAFSPERKGYLNFPAQDANLGMEKVTGKIPTIYKTPRDADYVKLMQNLQWLANGGEFFPAQDKVSVPKERNDYLYNFTESEDSHPVISIKLTKELAAPGTVKDWVEFPHLGRDARGVHYRNPENGAEAYYLLFNKGEFVPPQEIKIPGIPAFQKSGDVTAPKIISVKAPRKTAEARIQIEFETEDDSDGRQNHQTEFNLIEGANLLYLKAKDSAGNQAVWAVRVFRDTQAPEILDIQAPEITREKEVTVRYTVYDAVDGTKKVERKIELQEGWQTVTLEAQDETGNKIQKEIRLALDTTAPEIVIVSPFNSTTFEDSITLEYEIRDAVDGVTKQTKTFPLYFGENTFKLEAQDRAGNKTSVEVKVKKESPLAKPREPRAPPAAVGSKTELAETSEAVPQPESSPAQPNKPAPVPAVWTAPVKAVKSIFPTPAPENHPTQLVFPDSMKKLDQKLLGLREKQARERESALKELEAGYGELAGISADSKPIEDVSLAGIASRWDALKRLTLQVNYEAVRSASRQGYDFIYGTKRDIKTLVKKRRPAPFLIWRPKDYDWQQAYSEISFQDKTKVENPNLEIQAAIEKIRAINPSVEYFWVDLAPAFNEKGQVRLAIYVVGIDSSAKEPFTAFRALEVREGEFEFSQVPAGQDFNRQVIEMMHRLGVSLPGEELSGLKIIEERRALIHSLQREDAILAQIEDELQKKKRPDFKEDFWQEYFSSNWNQVLDTARASGLEQFGISRLETPLLLHSSQLEPVVHEAQILRERQNLSTPYRVSRFLNAFTGSFALKALLGPLHYWMDPLWVLEYRIRQPFYPYSRVFPGIKNLAAQFADFSGVPVGEKTVKAEKVKTSELLRQRLLAWQKQRAEAERLKKESAELEIAALAAQAEVLPPAPEVPASNPPAESVSQPEPASVTQVEAQPAVEEPSEPLAEPAPKQPEAVPPAVERVQEEEAKAPAPAAEIESDETREARWQEEVKDAAKNPNTAVDLAWSYYEFYKSFSGDEEEAAPVFDHVIQLLEVVRVARPELVFTRAQIRYHLLRAMILSAFNEEGDNTGSIVTDLQAGFEITERIPHPDLERDLWIVGAQLDPSNKEVQGFYGYLEKIKAKREKEFKVAELRAQLKSAELSLSDRIRIENEILKTLPGDSQVELAKALRVIDSWIQDFRYRLSEVENPDLKKLAEFSARLREKIQGLRRFNNSKLQKAYFDKLDELDKTRNVLDKIQPVWRAIKRLRDKVESGDVEQREFEREHRVIEAEVERLKSLLHENTHADLSTHLRAVSQLFARDVLKQNVQVEEIPQAGSSSAQTVEFWSIELLEEVDAAQTLLKKVKQERQSNRTSKPFPDEVFQTAETALEVLASDGLIAGFTSAQKAAVEEARGKFIRFHLARSQTKAAPALPAILQKDISELFAIFKSKMESAQRSETRAEDPNRREALKIMSASFSSLLGASSAAPEAAAEIVASGGAQFTLTPALSKALDFVASENRAAGLLMNMEDLKYIVEMIANLGAEKAVDLESLDLKDVIQQQGYLHLSAILTMRMDGTKEALEIHKTRIQDWVNARRSLLAGDSAPAIAAITRVGRYFLQEIQQLELKKPLKLDLDKGRFFTSPEEAKAAHQAYLAFINGSKDDPSVSAILDEMLHRFIKNTLEDTAEVRRILLSLKEPIKKAEQEIKKVVGLEVDSWENRPKTAHPAMPSWAVKQSTNLAPHPLISRTRSESRNQQDDKNEARSSTFEKVLMAAAPIVLLGLFLNAAFQDQYPDSRFPLGEAIRDYIRFKIRKSDSIESPRSLEAPPAPVLPPGIETFEAANPDEQEEAERRERSEVRRKKSGGEKETDIVSVLKRLGFEALEEGRIPEVPRTVDEEMIETLNVKGEKTGVTKSRREVHRDGNWHPVVHVLMRDSEGNVYLQQRSSNRSQSAGKLQSTVSGHVIKGQSIQAAASEESREESGIVLDPSRLLEGAVFTQSTQIVGGENNEIVHIKLYDLNETELSDLGKKFNRREMDRIWKIPASKLKNLAEEYPQFFSNTLLSIVRTQPQLMNQIQKRSEARQFFQQQNAKLTKEVIQQMIDSMQFKGFLVGEILGEFTISFEDSPNQTDVHNLREIKRMLEYKHSNYSFEIEDNRSWDSADAYYLHIKPKSKRSEARSQKEINQVAEQVIAAKRRTENVEFDLGGNVRDAVRLFETLVEIQYLPNEKFGVLDELPVRDGKVLNLSLSTPQRQGVWVPETAFREHYKSIQDSNSETILNKVKDTNLDGKNERESEAVRRGEIENEDSEPVQMIVFHSRTKGWYRLLEYPFKASEVSGFLEAEADKFEGESIPWHFKLIWKAGAGRFDLERSFDLQSFRSEVRGPFSESLFAQLSNAGEAVELLNPVSVVLSAALAIGLGLYLWWRFRTPVLEWAVGSPRQWAKKKTAEYKRALKAVSSEAEGRALAQKIYDGYGKIHSDNKERMFLESELLDALEKEFSRRRKAAEEKAAERTKKTEESQSPAPARQMPALKAEPDTAVSEEPVSRVISSEEKIGAALRKIEKELNAILRDAQKKTASKNVRLFLEQFEASVHEAIEKAAQEKSLNSDERSRLEGLVKESRFPAEIKIGIEKKIADLEFVEAEARRKAVAAQLEKFKKESSRYAEKVFAGFVQSVVQKRDVSFYPKRAQDYFAEQLNEKVNAMSSFTEEERRLFQAAADEQSAVLNARIVQTIREGRELRGVFLQTIRSFVSRWRREVIQQKELDLRFWIPRLTDDIEAAKALILEDFNRAADLSAPETVLAAERTALAAVDQKIQEYTEELDKKYLTAAEDLVKFRESLLEDWNRQLQPQRTARPNLPKEIFEMAAAQADEELRPKLEKISLKDKSFFAEKLEAFLIENFVSSIDSAVKEKREALSAIAQADYPEAFFDGVYEQLFVHRRSFSKNPDLIESHGVYTKALDKINSDSRLTPNNRIALSETLQATAEELRHLAQALKTGYEKRDKGDYLGAVRHFKGVANNTKEDSTIRMEAVYEGIQAALLGARDNRGLNREAGVLAAIGKSIDPNDEALNALADKIPVRNNRDLFAPQKVSLAPAPIVPLNFSAQDSEEIAPEGWERKWEERLAALRRDLETREGAVTVFNLRDDVQVRKFLQEFNEQKRSLQDVDSRVKSQVTLKIEKTLFEISRRLIAQALNRDPNFLSQALRRAKELRSREVRRFAEAAALYEAVTQRELKDRQARSVAFLGLGISLSSIKDYKAAETALNEGIDLDPENGFLLSRLAWNSFFQGVELKMSGKGKQAAEWFRKTNEQSDRALEMQNQETRAAAWQVKISALVEIGTQAEVEGAMSQARAEFPKIDLSQQEERFQNRSETRGLRDYWDSLSDENKKVVFVILYFLNLASYSLATQLAGTNIFAVLVPAAAAAMLGAGLAAGLLAKKFFSNKREIFDWSVFGGHLAKSDRKTMEAVVEGLPDDAPPREMAALIERVYRRLQSASIYDPSRTRETARKDADQFLIWLLNISDSEKALVRRVFLESFPKRGSFFVRVLTRASLQEPREREDFLKKQLRRRQLQERREGENTSRDFIRLSRGTQIISEITVPVEQSESARLFAKETAETLTRAGKTVGKVRIWEQRNPWVTADRHWDEEDLDEANEWVAEVINAKEERITLWEIPVDYVQTSSPLKPLILELMAAGFADFNFDFETVLAGRSFGEMEQLEKILRKALQRKKRSPFRDFRFKANLQGHEYSGVRGNQQSVVLIIKEEGKKRAVSPYDFESEQFVKFRVRRSETRQMKGEDFSERPTLAAPLMDEDSREAAVLRLLHTSRWFVLGTGAAAIYFQPLFWSLNLAVAAALAGIYFWVGSLLRSRQASLSEKQLSEIPVLDKTHLKSNAKIVLESGAEYFSRIINRPIADQEVPSLLYWAKNYNKQLDLFRTQDLAELSKKEKEELDVLRDKYQAVLNAGEDLRKTVRLIEAFHGEMTQKAISLADPEKTMHFEKIVPWLSELNQTLVQVQASVRANQERFGVAFHSLGVEANLDSLKAALYSNGSSDYAKMNSLQIREVLLGYAENLRKWRQTLADQTFKANIRYQLGRDLRRILEPSADQRSESRKKQPPQKPLAERLDDLVNDVDAVLAYSNSEYSKAIILDKLKSVKEYLERRNYQAALGVLNDVIYLFPESSFKDLTRVKRELVSFKRDLSNETGNAGAGLKERKKRLGRKRSETREAVRAVGLGLTAKIFGLGTSLSEFLLPAVQAAPSLSDQSAAEWIKALPPLELSEKVHAVIPAAFFAEIEPMLVRDYFKQLNQSGGNVKDPVIHVAGDSENKLRGIIFSAKNGALSAGGKRPFDFTAQNEAVIAERYANEKVSVSSARGAGGEALRRLPSFVIDEAGLRGKSAAEKLKYIHRLIQLQLLAAEQLKSPVTSAQVERFLQTLSIEFDAQSEAVRPLAESLLSDKAGEILAARQFAASA